MVRARHAVPLQNKILDAGYQPGLSFISGRMEDALSFSHGVEKKHPIPLRDDFDRLPARSPQAD